MKTLAVLGTAVFAVALGGKTATCLAAASNVTLAFPADMVTSKTTAPTAAQWNKPGNRCQYNCSTGQGGPADVGLSASATAFVAHGLTPLPKLEFFSDGRIVARSTNPVLFAALSDTAYDVYVLSMQTRCAHHGTCFDGTRAGLDCDLTSPNCPGSFFGCLPNFCNNSNECQGDLGTSFPNDQCLLCDGSGCQDLHPELCPNTCASGATKGQECDPLNNTCGAGIACNATDACRTLRSCGAANGAFCAGLPVKDCRANGAPVASGETVPSTVNTFLGTAPLHAASATVTGVGWNGAIGGASTGPFVIGSQQTVFRMVTSTQSNPYVTCSNNCAGTPIGAPNSHTPIGGCQ